jgi:hypothetical protein
MNRCYAIIVGVLFSLAFHQPADAEKSPWLSPSAWSKRPLFVQAAKTPLVSTLLRSYRQDGKGHAGSGLEGRRLEFSGVRGKDVYNPTKPFLIDGRTVMAARVESRTSETDSEVRFFERSRSGRYLLLPGAPRFKLQDPFVTHIGKEIVLGGVEVTPLGEGRTSYKTVFFRGSTLDTLRRFAEGPPRMKDIRLTGLPDGRVFVLTRPQGTIGGKGTIGYTILDSLDAINPQAIQSARLLPRQFAKKNHSWGGANEILPLGQDRLGVLGHIAREDSKGRLHYYPMSFTIDLRQGIVGPMKILLERADLPGGLGRPAKWPRVKNVLFSGGLERHGDGTATLTVGSGDSEVVQKHIPDPFSMF